ncbi:putative Dol-P-Man:Man(5)GlcNAc(2)-PP-Dol alpha-1,3-mannosyltransferase [Gorgonomyces haynaldii]|nr:putative Dol-P-Man:Man(5)GlcNAc(2)-PP-Dol alpha-1,3-mannosyltransferase [Gorgonomyces haynaldii]
MSSIVCLGSFSVVMMFPYNSLICSEILSTSMQTFVQLGISLGLISLVRYTEIDYSTYLEQVSLFLGGETDYFNIQGPTGPVVYPAGFIYVFSLFKILCGDSIRMAQVVFALLQAYTVHLVSGLYTSTNQSHLIPFLMLSKRIHSIFVLRLFNDPIAVLLMFVCIKLMVDRRFVVASVFYSLALSVKMNILLFAPGMAFLYWTEIGVWNALYCGLIVVLVQVGLGLPFLLQAPGHYLERSFDFQRQFLYKWTVNWRFITQDIFLSSWFSKILLFLHLVFLLLLLRQWARPYGGINNALARGWRFKRLRPTPLDPKEVLFVLFSSNFVGIVFARSLHYQFYSWYFYTLPFLLQCTKYHILVQLLLFIGIEYCWNVYPSTIQSSGLLFVCHLLTLLGILRTNLFQKT